MTAVDNRSWGLFYRKLSKHTGQNGHCYIPFPYPRNPALCQWFWEQVRLSAQGDLPEEHASQLGEIGFDPEFARISMYQDAKLSDAMLDQTWQHAFEKLQNYYHANSHSNVIAGIDDDLELAKWAKLQRKHYRENRLSIELVFCLTSIEFLWSQRSARWERMFKWLKDYHLATGSWRIEPKISDLAVLRLWVRTQRQKKRKGQLQKVQIRKLNSIQFDWENDPHWSAKLDRTLSCMDETGPAVDRWLEKQIFACKAGKLSRYQINQLKERGVIPQGIDSEWKKMYESLRQWLSQHRLDRDPCRMSQDLRDWIAEQRGEKRQEKLCLAKIDALNRIGFVWTIDDERWEAMYDRMQRFLQLHSNFAVGYKRDKKLAKWMEKQRGNMRCGKIREDRRVKLDSIGFPWKVGIQHTWESRFREFVSYAKTHSHIDPKKLRKSNPGLMKWMYGQRHKYRNGKMSRAKYLALRKVGFVFSPRDDEWQRKFQKLAEIKEAHGSISSESLKGLDILLFRWLTLQKVLIGEGMLAEWKIKCLEQLDLS